MAVTKTRTEGDIIIQEGSVLVINLVETWDDPEDDALPINRKHQVALGRDADTNAAPDLTSYSTLVQNLGAVVFA